MKTIVIIASVLAFAIIFWSISFIIPLYNGGDLARGMLWALEGAGMVRWVQYVESSEWTKLTIK